MVAACLIGGSATCQDEGLVTPALLEALRNGSRMRNPPCEQEGEKEHADTQELSNLATLLARGGTAAGSTSSAPLLSAPGFGNKTKRRFAIPPVADGSGYTAVQTPRLSARSASSSSEGPAVQPAEVVVEEGVWEVHVARLFYQRPQASAPSDDGGTPFAPAAGEGATGRAKGPGRAGKFGSSGLRKPTMPSLHSMDSREELSAVSKRTSSNEEEVQQQVRESVQRLQRLHQLNLEQKGCEQPQLPQMSPRCQLPRPLQHADVLSGCDSDEDVSLEVEIPMGRRLGLNERRGGGQTASEPDKRRMLQREDAENFDQRRAASPLRGLETVDALLPVPLSDEELPLSLAEREAPKVHSPAGSQQAAAAADTEGQGARLPVPQPAAGVEDTTLQQAPAAELPLPAPAISVEAATVQRPLPQTILDVEVDGVLGSLRGCAVNSRGSADGSANGLTPTSMEPLLVSSSRLDRAIAEVLETSGTVPRQFGERQSSSRPPHWSGELSTCWDEGGAVPACIPQAVLHQAIGPVLTSSDWSAGVAKACHGFHKDELVKAAESPSTSKLTVPVGATGTPATAPTPESDAPFPAPMRQKPRNRPVTRGASGVPVAVRGTDWLDVQSSERTELSLDFI